MSETEKAEEVPRTTLEEDNNSKQKWYLWLKIVEIFLTLSMLIVSIFMWQVTRGQKDIMEEQSRIIQEQTKILEEQKIISELQANISQINLELIEPHIECWWSLKASRNRSVVNVTALNTGQLPAVIYGTIIRQPKHIYVSCGDPCIVNETFENITRDWSPAIVINEGETRTTRNIEFNYTGITSVSMYAGNSIIGPREIICNNTNQTGIWMD